MLVNERRMTSSALSDVGEGRYHNAPVAENKGLDDIHGEGPDILWTGPGVKIPAVQVHKTAIA